MLLGVAEQERGGKGKGFLRSVEHNSKMLNGAYNSVRKLALFLFQKDDASIASLSNLIEMFWSNLLLGLYLKLGCLTKINIYIES